MYGALAHAATTEQAAELYSLTSAPITAYMDAHASAIGAAGVPAPGASAPVPDDAAVASGDMTTPGGAGSTDATAPGSGEITPSSTAAAGAAGAAAGAAVADELSLSLMDSAAVWKRGELS